jgi:toluene monooxygenase electron transfer component
MEITVQSKSGQLSFDCDTHESILHAGLRRAIGLPFECATGTCGTCRARVMSGEVDVRWKEAPGGARLKPEKGDILMCQSHALTDCVLRIPSDVSSSVNSPPASHRGVLRNIELLTHDVVHFDVELSWPMAFMAGQFVVLEAAGVTGGRAYSMTNHDSSCERLSLLLKRKPGGHFSQWLFDAANDGTRVDVFGPLGRATFHPEEHRDIVCIAGGSGIAGMMSILACAGTADHFAERKGALFFGVRTLADTFYLEQLSRHVASSGGNLEVTIALSDETPDSNAHDVLPNLKLAHGMVHEVAAREMSGRDNNVLAYIAGPPIMVDATVRSLVKGGVAVRDIRYDKFG